MIIRILSFDFDGCLFNRSYIASADKDVIHSNRALLDKIRSESSTYATTVVFVGSNRQSKTIDICNSFRKGSCFPAVKKVSEYLHATLDPFLLADVYGNLPDGTSYHRAMDPESLEHAEWVFDDTKVSIMYAQMHKMSQKYPGDTVVFDFYDDKDNILNALEGFYSAHPQLIPRNVTLQLHHYEGGEVTPKEKITGTGAIDNDYRGTVQKMAERADIRKRERAQGGRVDDGVNIAYDLTAEDIEEFQATQLYPPVPVPVPVTVPVLAPVPVPVPVLAPVPVPVLAPVPVPVPVSSSRNPGPASIPVTTPSCINDISWMVLNGFIAAVGVAAIALAFTVLNGATLGITGLVGVGLGTAATLVGIGLFAHSYKNEHSERAVTDSLIRVSV